MAISPLATESYPAYTGNYTKGRSGRKIEAVTIHHMACKATAASCGATFQRVGREGSSHYGIGYAGEIANYVDENDTAWTNSNWDSNCKSVTIETSNIAGAPGWEVSDESYHSLINLVADIAKRNNLYPLVKGQNLTWHCMFAATSCPGTYLLSKLDEIVDQANAIISGKTPTPTPAPSKADVDVYYSAYTGQWLDTVTNCNDANYNGYAGWDGKPFTGLKATLSRGHIKYRVHLTKGFWCDWIVDCDAAQDGYAGILGQTIDGVQMELVGLPSNYHVQYRTRLLNGQYLGWITDCGDGDDGYSGLWGKALDRIQIKIVQTPEPKEVEETPKEDPVETTEPVSENPPVEEVPPTVEEPPEETPPVVEPVEQPAEQTPSVEEPTADPVPSEPSEEPNSDENVDDVASQGTVTLIFKIITLFIKLFQKLFGKDK